MTFQIIPIAEASVVTLMRSIDRVIINPLIVFLFALAMAYFIFGIVKYLLSPGNEEVRKQSRSQMIWGVIGMFIMISVFGIMRMILTSLGENNITVEQNGSYTVGQMQ